AAGWGPWVQARQGVWCRSWIHRQIKSAMIALTGYTWTLRLYRLRPTCPCSTAAELLPGSSLDIGPALRHSTRPYLYPNSLDFLRSKTVANSPQAKKRAKQAEKRRNHNASLRSMVRTYIKNVVKAIEAKDLEKAQTAYTAAVPVIDRMADKGIINKNKAARHKSRLNAHIKAMATAA